MTVPDPSNPYPAIAAGVRFGMAAANHLSSGPSSFPFTIFPGRGQDETLETFQMRAISAHVTTLMAGTPAELADIATAIRRSGGMAP